MAVSSFYQSYVRAFGKYAEATLNKSKYYKDLATFAYNLSNMATKLLVRAALNTKVNLRKLQKEINEIGSSYIRRFADKFRDTNPNDVKKKR